MTFGSRFRRALTVPFPDLAPLTRVALAIALPALALLLCEWLRPILDPAFEAPFIAAIAVTCWLCGPRIGLVSTAVAALVLDYFFLPPRFSLVLQGWDSVVRLVTFAAVSLVIVAVMMRLQKAHAELAYSEERYRNLADLIPFGGWGADGSGNMVHVSDSFLETFRVPLKECQGLGWLKLLHQDDRQHVLEAWMDCVRSGGFWDYEYRMRAPDGKERVVLSRGVPTFDANGQRRSWTGLHLDVTERARSTEERLKQARDLARFNAELEQFAYISAHDLQEPLRMIASYLQLLQKRYKGKLEGDADQYIDYAVEGANRLRALLQDLMLLQQVGKRREKREPCDLAELMAAVKQRLAPAIAQSKANVVVEELPAAPCDRRELLQLLLNLVDNGLKYRDENRAPVVRISATREGEMWKICVADNGIGIEEQYLDRIFDVFQRLHPRSLYPGTGIGLAICKKIVEVHGGAIWAESQPGVGTTVCFTLPVQ